MVKLRVLSVGDIHANVKNTTEIDLLAERILECAKARKPDVIAVLGDLHDTFEKIHVQALNTIEAFFDKLAEANVPVFYIVGNHCMINNSCFLDGNHAFNVFKGKKNLIIVDKPLALEHNGVKIGMCPYVYPGRFREALATSEHFADLKSFASIYCHQEFEDAQMGAVVSTIGDKIGDDLPMIYSGHIHDRQLLHGKVLYVGTPRHTNYGETGNRFFSLVEYNEDGTQKEEPINTNMPRKVTITALAENFEDLEIEEGAEVRLIISGTSEEILKIKNSKKFKELSEKLKVILKPADKRSVSVKGQTYDYLTLLKNSVSSESARVQEVFKEVVGAVKTS